MSDAQAKPSSTREHIEDFERTLEQFRRGDVAPGRFSAARVSIGIYEERTAGLFLVRIRLPAGRLEPFQALTVASVASSYGTGSAHVTTRRDIQIRGIVLDSLVPVLCELAHSGLSTRGCGGNTVRGVVACDKSGGCFTEIFDVGPHSIALADYLLADRIALQLPRKLKISFSGCDSDCGLAAIQDIGFVARVRGDVRGFAVYVGGGMGASSRVGHLFDEFVPAQHIHRLASAVMHVFHEHGSWKSKRKARIRFLVERLGLDEFRRLVRHKLESPELSAPALDVQYLERPASVRAPLGEDDSAPGFALWQKRNVEPQHQRGMSMIHVQLPGGDIPSAKLKLLAEAALECADGPLLATARQTFLLQGVRDEELRAVHARLHAIGLADAPPAVLRDMRACVGSRGCKLGICNSPALAQALAERLSRDDVDLDDSNLRRINISGCPDSCGHHPVAQIGFMGAARRHGSLLSPHYIVHLGARLEIGQTKLAEPGDVIHAKAVPEFTAALVQAFRRSPSYPDFDAFLDNGGRQEAAAIAARLSPTPEVQQPPDFYCDIGECQAFSLEGRGPGECGAGVLDIVEGDLSTASAALQAGRLYAATVYSARALLVTRGIEARDDMTALRAFRTEFVEAGLADPAVVPVLEEAEKQASDRTLSDCFRSDVAMLVQVVRKLYGDMDDALQFKPARVDKAPVADEVPERSADLRGVVCPLNYVKAKMLLSTMRTGNVLKLLLDGAGARNVPESVQRDGHTIRSMRELGDHWELVVAVR